MALIFEFLAILTTSVCLVYAAEKPCCFSKRYIANMTIVTAIIEKDSSTPTFSENRVHIDYDKDRRREKIYGYVIEGAGMNQTTNIYNVWNDYTTGQRYGYINNASNCTVGPIGHEQLDRCVPDTFRLAATYLIGSGKEAMRVNSWVGVSNNFQYTYVTTVNDCTPISTTSYGNGADGSSVMENIQFSDVTQYKVSSDDVFDIPQACLTDVNTQVGK